MSWYLWRSARCQATKELFMSASYKKGNLHYFSSANVQQKMFHVKGKTI